MPRWRLSWVALLVAAVCGPVSTQAQETQPGTLRGKRILVLNSYMRGTPYTELQEAGIRQALESHPSGPTWVRYEYLDGYPKSDAAALRFAEILEERYSNPPIDVVLTTDSPALMFAAEHRDWLFPGRPIVFSAPSSIPPDLRKRTPNVTGIVEEIDAVRTIRLMRRLFPDRPKIVGIISESDYGVMLRDSIQIALAKETPPIVVEWWLDRDPRGLRQKAAELPPDHVVLFCNAGVMSIGLNDGPESALAKFCAESSAPVFTLFDLYLGDGPIGGFLTSGEHYGKTAASLAIRVLRGTPADEVPIIETGSTVPMFDWRALQRWGIEEHDLPAGSQIRFRTPSFVEQYWAYIVAGTGIVVVQSVTIGALYINRLRYNRSQRALKLTEERFARAATAGAVGVWEVEVAARRIHIEPGFLQHIGIETSETSFSDEAVLAFIHADDAPAVRRAFKDFMAGEKATFDVEYRIVRPDGRVIWMLSRGQIVRDAGRDAVRVFGTSVDITLRREVEEQLRVAQVSLEQRVLERTAALNQAVAELARSERRYRGIVESQRDLVCRYSPDTTLTFANEAYCQYFGKSREALLGRPFTELLPEPMRAAAARQVALLQPDEPARLYIQRIVEPDGRIIWREWHDHVIFDDAGHIVEYQSVGRDITRRKEAEGALNFQREVLEQIALGRSAEEVLDRVCVLLEDNLPGGAWQVLDALEDGRLRLLAAPHIGDAMREELERIRLDAVYGGTVDAADISRPAYIADVGADARFAVCRDGFSRLGVRGCWIVPIASRAREILGVLVSTRSRPGMPTSHEAELCEVAAQLGGIALQRQRDEAAVRANQDRLRQQTNELAHVARLAVMGEMAAGLAHELNQPLTAAMNHAEASMLSLRAGAARQDHLLTDLEAVAEQTYRAAQIVRNLRGFVGKQDGKRERVDVNRLLHDVVLLAAPELRRSHTRLTTDLAADLPKVHVNTVQIQQVVLNLIRNAIEALDPIPPEAREICLDSRATEDRRSIEITVRDCGRGIGPEQEDKVFTPFFTTRLDGLGMGLCISRTIIERHRGRIWFTKNSGPGVTFHFTIPAISENMSA